MPWVNLEFPIGWDELGVIATTIAVIVALKANHNANVQLKKSLQMHEQSKNIGLLDRRLQVIQQIKEKRYPTDDEMSILFSGEIFDEYKLLEEKISDIVTWEKKQKNYEYLLQLSYPKTNGEVPLELINKARWSSLNGDDQEYLELCEKYELRVPEELSEGEEVYNHAQIIGKITESRELAQKQYDKLIALMRDYTKLSIEPLIKEGKKS